jgi:hypothetical protein
MFSLQEQAYLQTQMLARLGTVAPDGQPDVDVVGFQFDGTHFSAHFACNIVAGTEPILACSGLLFFRRGYASNFQALRWY